MRNRLLIEVQGRPRPQGSHGVNPTTGKVYPMAKGLHAWRQSIAEHSFAAAYREGIRYEHGEPLRVVCHFFYRRPKHHFRGGLLKAEAPTAKTSPPDVDKLLRAVLDGLVQGGVLPDDAQVASTTSEKAWGTDDRVEISIHPLDWIPVAAYARA